MNLPRIEGLEQRQMFQASPLIQNPTLSVADVTAILAQAASQERKTPTASGLPAQTQAIVVEDRSGNVLGEYDGSGLVVGPNMTQEEINEIRLDAALRARTSSFFESSGEAFTTRTARFIIQNHFPAQVQNTSGGPLYGVQFSSTASSDTIPVDLTAINSPFLVADPDTGAPLIDELGPAGLSGDPGGVPLYIMGLNSKGKKVAVAVGSIGVAGDFSDTAARKDLVLGNTLLPNGMHQFQYAYAADPKGNFFQGNEKPDFDESVAEAGSSGFMAPHGIQATAVFVGGLRLPFLASPVAHANPSESLADLIVSDMGTLPVSFGTTTPVANLRDTPAGVGLNSGTPYTIDTVKGPENGTLVRRNLRANPSQVDQNYGYVASNDTDPNTGLPDSQLLTVDDVSAVIETALNRAETTRAGIRQPIGTHVVVYITVVDRDGDLLGAFAMNDATNFSYDVAVQKARTAAYFSDDTHAFSDTALGFISQRYFPIGINDAQEGPLYELQNGLKTADLNSSAQIIDDTMKPIGEVTAPIANPVAAGTVIPVANLGTNILHTGEIVTFGTDPTFATRVLSDAAATSANDTSNEYLITSVTPAGITVQSDGIDPSATGVLPLAAGDAIIPKNPLKNGITIFPGGFPLYKNGVMVGAIGVSGDGVTQDDIIAYSGTGALDPEGTGAATNFRPPMKYESDALAVDNIATYIGSKVQSIEDTFELGSAFTTGLSYTNLITDAEQRLEKGLPQDRLPYAKFPRNPFI